MITAKKRALEILMVEDNLKDYELTVDAFEEVETPAVFHHVQDGEEAMAFLRKESKYANSPNPDLVLLDLKLPRKTGQEVLADMKTDKNLRHIPVVIFTSSRSLEDIRTAYDHYANCYITKPPNTKKGVEVARSIVEYWSNTVQLPT